MSAADHHLAGGSTVSIKQPPQPKVFSMYATILNESKIIRDEQFWHELLLLWANVDRLTDCISALSQSQLLAKKSIINNWSQRCIKTATGQPISIRTVNAMRTFTGLARGVAGRPPRAFGIDRVDILLGAESADALMKTLIDTVCQRLYAAHQHVTSVTHAHINMLLALITCCDNIDGNVLIEYVLASNLFDAMIKVLGTVGLRTTFGRDVLLLMSLLVNYRKYDNINPCIVQLSILDDELALNGYNQTIATELVKYNNRFRKQVSASDSTGLFSSFSNWIGGIFVPEQTALTNITTDEMLLMAMYEAVHLNRNFITTLTNVSAHNDKAFRFAAARAANSSFDRMDSIDQGPSSEQDDAESNRAGKLTSWCISSMTYAREKMRRTAEQASESATMCALILTCIVEDQYANSLMHDVNMSFRVPLYRTPMLHRAGLFDKSPPLSPLACTVFELAKEFISSHLMKSLPFDMYLWMLSIVHKILCYQKRFRVRLQYSWRELWTALFSLLKFLVVHESVLMAQHDLFLMFNKIVTILNLFVTFGDTFLPTACVYDQLYYELMRQSDTFDDLHALAVRYLQTARPDSARHASVTRLVNQLMNIRGIIAHFNAKLDKPQVTTLTEQEVLLIIRNNYDTLTLKLYENLDVFERYNERPKQMDFFRAQVCRILQSTRCTVNNDPRVTAQVIVQQLAVHKLSQSS